MKQKFINVASYIAVKSGLTRILSKFNKTPRIIYYHGIETNISDSYIQGVHISEKKFREHLDYLKKNFEVISIDQFTERFESNSFKGNEVVITFDDGYKNNLTVAAPILKEYNFPFTVFLSTALVDDTSLRFPTFIIRAIVMKCKNETIQLNSINKKYILSNKAQRREVAQGLIAIAKKAPNAEVNSLLQDLISNISHEEYKEICNAFISDEAMNWEDVKKIMEYNCTLASHCDEHFICHENQTREEILYQLIQSRNKITQVQGSCHYFAFPNGTNCELARKLTNKVGYKMSFSTKYKHINYNADTTAMYRLPVPLNVDRFKLMMSL